MDSATAASASCYSRVVRISISYHICVHGLKLLICPFAQSLGLQNMACEYIAQIPRELSVRSFWSHFEIFKNDRGSLKWTYQTWVNTLSKVCCISEGKYCSLFGRVERVMRVSPRESTDPSPIPVQVEGAGATTTLHQLLLFISRLSDETLELLSENDQQSLSIARCLEWVTTLWRQRPRTLFLEGFCCSFFSSPCLPSEDCFGIYKNSLRFWVEFPQHTLCL